MASPSPAIRLTMACCSPRFRLVAFCSFTVLLEVYDKGSTCFAISPTGHDSCHVEKGGYRESGGQVFSKVLLCAFRNFQKEQEALVGP